MDKTRSRRHCHRRHYELHQYQQSLRDGRRGPPGQKGGGKRPARSAVCKTSLAPGRRVVTDYFNKAGLSQISRSTRIQHRWIRLHNLHRQLRPAAGGDRQGGREPRSGGGGSSLRQSQFRRPNQSARESQLSRQPAAGGGIRPGRDSGYEHHGRADRSRTRGEPVYLRDIWPTPGRGRSNDGRMPLPGHVPPPIRQRRKRQRQWNQIPVKGGELFKFDETSTYIQEPPFFENLTRQPGQIQPIKMPACWSWSATALRPTTSPRPVRSRRTARPGNT